MNSLRLRTLVAVTVALLLLSAPLIAAVLPGSGGPKGPVRETSARPNPTYKVHDVGNLWTAISNFGNYGEPNENLPSGEWPGGSSINYIWEGRFWIAALVGGEPLCSHADYGNYELDPTEGSYYYFGAGPKSILDGWVRYDDMTDYSGHTPIGFEMSQRALTWSIPEYDDFFVILMEVKNVSGGTINGAFVTWVFDNDCGAGEGGDPDQPNIDDLVDYDGWARSATGAEENMFTQDWVDPLDLDNDGDTGYDVWGWERANPFNPYVNGYEDADMPESFDPEPDGVWDEYQIYEVEDGPAIYGQPGTDFDGQVLIKASTGDTLKGYLISRNTSYMYDGDYPQSGENDTGERTYATPVDGFIGTRMIYIPQDPFYLTEDDTMPRPYSHQWWNWESDPGSDREKYEYMTGTHSLSNGIKFMPHPFRYGAGAPVFDYRYMLSCGPFSSWADGETKKFVMVTGIGKGIGGMREILDNAVIAYYQGPDSLIGDPVISPVEAQAGFTGASNEAIASDKHFLLPIPPPIPDLHYSGADRAVDMVWDKSAENEIDNFLGAVDFEGYKVYRSLYNAQNMQIIAAFDNRDEPVLLKDTDGNMVNPIRVNGELITYFEDGYQEAIAAGGYDTVLVDLPDVRNTYTDRGGDFMGVDESGNPITFFHDIPEPVNGLKYYYTVVAYDPDKIATFGLSSIESAKSNYRKTLAGAPDPVIPRPDAIVKTDDGTGTMDDGYDGTPRKACDVRVVPNPYEGTALFESRYEDRLAFFFLPPLCKISIFTLTGDLVKEIEHEDATSGAEYWDMISRNNQKVVSGLYIYVVETPDGDKHIGKFLIKR